MVNVSDCAGEEWVRDSLVKRFPSLSDKVRIQRIRRVFADVPSDNFQNIFIYAVKELGFSALITITGLDEGQTLGFIYHIARPEGMTLNLKISVPKENPVLRTITDQFPGAEIYEREVEDLFGAKVEGLKKGKRYPLPDDWPQGQHPLLKDWKREGK